MHVSLFLLIAVAAAIWGVLQFVALPRVERWEGRAIAKAGARAALGYVRMFAFVALITYVAFAIVVKLASVNAAWVIDLSNRSHTLYEVLEKYDHRWAAVLVFALIAALVYSVARGARKAETAENEAYMLGEWEKVDAQREAGTLEELPLSYELQDITRKIEAREAMAEHDEEGNMLLPERVVDELRALYRAYYVQDTLRRIPPRPEPPPGEARRSWRGTVVDQFGAVLTSRSAVKLGTGSRRAIHVALTVLLCLSMLTVTADAAVAHEIGQEAVSLSQVNVARQYEESQHEVASVLPQPTLASPRPLTQPEVRAARSFSSAFARALERSHAIEPFHLPGAHDVGDLQNAHVRSMILEQLQSEPHLGLASTQSLDAAARATAERIDRGGTVPNDPVARRTERRLEDALSRVPQRTSEELLAKIARSTSFSPLQPDALSFTEIRSALTGQAFGEIYDAALGHGPADITNQFRSAFGEGWGESLDKYVETLFNRYTTTAVHDGTSVALSRVAEPGSDADRFGQGLLGDLRDRYAQYAGWDRLVTETRAHPPSAPTREIRPPRWALDAPPRGASQWATTFDDIAPAGFGDDLRSSRSSIENAHRSSLGREGPSIPKIGEPVPAEIARDLARVETSGTEAVLSGGRAVASNATLELAGGLMRSRSYALLSGFSRIGGVLIGEGPQHSSDTDCRTFDWQFLTGDRVALRLSGPKCDWHGTAIDRVTLARALAYAADGRPVATTMVSSAPLLDGLSVHPHPALVDSQIGREASKIDMFIDTYYRRGDANDPRYTALAAAVEDQILLYHVALAVRDRAVATRLSDRLTDATIGYLNDEAQYVEQQFGADDVAAALHDAAKNAGTGTSILHAKSAYFDPELVAVVDACSASTSRADYRSCVDGKVGEADFSDDTRMKSWLNAQVVNYHLESGVRELPYEAASALTVNDDVAGSKAGIGPFRFEIHMTFYSSPTFAKSQADALNQDEHPFDLPAVEPNIRARILNVASTHADVQTTLHRMAAFTRAQRLFRLALAGQLGPAFPADRLVAFAHALAARPEPNVRTMRWLAHPEAYLEYSRAYTKRLSAVANASRTPATSRAAGAMAAGLVRCTMLALIDASATKRLVFGDGSCDFNRYAPVVASVSRCTTDDCAVIRKTYEFLKIMRLRKDLAVDVDDPDQLTPSSFFPGSS